MKGRRHVSRMNGLMAIPAAGLLLIGIVGCRGEPERAALARTPTADAVTRHSRSTPMVQLRRLWGGSEFSFYVGSSSPSPDGRYVTEVDWSTGDLAVQGSDSVARIHDEKDHVRHEQRGTDLLLDVGAEVVPVELLVRRSTDAG